MTELRIERNIIASIPDMSKFTQLAVFNFDRQKMLKIGQLPEKIDKQIDKLEYSNMQLKEVPDVRALKSLVSLNMSNNSIKELDTSRLPTQLKELNL